MQPRKAAALSAQVESVLGSTKVRENVLSLLLSLESFILLSSLSLVPSILSVYKHTANLYAHRLWAMGSLDLGSG